MLRSAGDDALAAPTFLLAKVTIMTFGCPFSFGALQFRSLLTTDSLTIKLIRMVLFRKQQPDFDLLQLLTRILVQ